VFLATKLGARPTLPGTGFETAEGLSRDAIRHEIDQSLERLQTDYVDLYYAHVDDKKTPLEDTMEGSAEVVAAGKARCIGCSNYPTERVRETKSISRENGWPEHCCIEQRYTYLEPDPGAKFAGGLQVLADKTLFDYCMAEGMSIVAYTSLLKGIYSKPEADLAGLYSGEYDNQANRERMAVLDRVVRESGATGCQAVLAWMMQNAQPLIPLFSSSRIEQLEENLKASEVTLSPEHIEMLDRAAQRGSPGE
jgi:aryl-alcohol dehydrogenase-like predicted oxidoreductase